MDGEYCLKLNEQHPAYLTMLNMLIPWQKQSKKLKDGETADEDYNHWRYTYPEGYTLK